MACILRKLYQECLHLSHERKLEENYTFTAKRKATDFLMFVLRQVFAKWFLLSALIFTLNIQDFAILLNVILYFLTKIIEKQLWKS